MPNGWGKEEFRKKLDEEMHNSREAFHGPYKKELNELLGLSGEDIDRITPDAADLRVYDELITIVKKASLNQISQAELRACILELGDLAVAIAKKVPGLAALLS